MRNTWICQEDGLQKTLICKFCEKFDGSEVPAVALEGQWAGGDIDIDPQWVPVCGKHQATWHTEECVIPQPDGTYEDGVQDIPHESRLPNVRLGDPNGDGFFGVDATALMERVAKAEHERQIGHYLKAAPEGSPVPPAWEDLEPNMRMNLKQNLLVIVTDTLRAYEES